MWSFPHLYRGRRLLVFMSHTPCLVWRWYWLRLFTVLSLDPRSDSPFLYRMAHLWIQYIPMTVIWPTYKKLSEVFCQNNSRLPNSPFVEYICSYITVYTQQFAKYRTEDLLWACAFKMTISYFWSSILARRIAQPCQELPDDNYVTTV